MKLPIQFMEQKNIIQIASLTDRVLLDINGHSGWGGNYSYGMCIAIDTELKNVNTDWLKHLCLWMASMRSSYNDALFIESDRLYLLRHYHKELNCEQYNLIVEQQIGLVQNLVRHYKHSMQTSH